MIEPKNRPGIHRDERISAEGLLRLERQLVAGAKMSKIVQAQWIKRYGEAAKHLFEQYLGVSE